MEINDITDAFTNTEFSVFKNVIAENGIINAIVVKNKADNFSRKDIDKLTDFVKTYKANALAFLKYNEEFTQCLEDGILYLLEKEFSNRQYFPFWEAVQSQYSTEEIANESNCECYLLD